MSGINKTAKPNDSSALPKRRRRWLRRLCWGIAAVVILWLVGDFAYSRYIAAQIADWENNISRDENGVRVGCQEFTYGTGPTAILLVHGFNETPQIWYKMTPALADQGFTCRALRLPGFGETIDEYGKSTCSQWLQKIDQEIEALQQQNHSRIIVVAHSLGGAVTIQHLLNNPGCIDGLVLLAPAINTSSVRSPFLTPRFWHEFGRYTLPFTRVVMSPFEYDAKDPEQLAVRLRNKFSPRTVISNLYQLIDQNRGRGDEIQTPTRIFYSPDDQVVDVEAILSFHESLNTTNKKLIKAENSGHAIPVDLDWQMVVDEIHRFANELAVGDGAQ